MESQKQEIIQAAIQLERDGVKFYNEIAAGASNNLAKQMFESLAGDELNHIAWIETLSCPEEIPSELKKELYARLKGIFAGAPEQMKTAAAKAPGDIKAIDLALKMEEKSRKAYETWGAESNEKEVTDLCNLLAEFEALHYQLLENMREYLEHPAEWFMQQERWNFEAG